MGFCDRASLQKQVWRHDSFVTSSMQFGCGGAPLQDFWHRQLASYKPGQVTMQHLSD
jgi:hypothetical protein